MNAEQLHAICIELNEEIDSNSLLKRLESLVNSLQNSINNPNEPTYQEEISNIRTKLYTSLEAIETSERPASKRQIIQEIGGSNLLGKALQDRIEESFTQLDVTPSLVHRDINELKGELKDFKDGIEELIAGFNRLDIGAEELDGFIAEVSVLIPRRDNSDDLESFSKDLGKINREFQHFNELVTGSAAPLKVRTISSSDFGVFLEVLPNTAQVIVSTIAILMLGYEKLLDIRKKRAELIEDEAPEPLIKEMDQWAESLMDKEVEKITADLMEQFKDVGRPDGRVNEVEGHVKLTVKKLAGRIDVGYHFSARIGKIEEPEQTEDAEDNESAQEEYEEQMALLSSIKENSSQIEYHQLEGDPVLPLDWRPYGNEEDS